jgi:glycosyltransferase involved in cell wall biosynthesis
MAPLVGIAGSFIFDSVLCVAESVRKDFARWAVPWKRSRFLVVRFGIEVAKPVPRQERLVGNVARLVGRKGHPILIEAWRHVLSDDRAAGWTLELWGEGPDRPLLERLVASVPGVTLVGSVHDASQHIGRFEIIVLPSLREGLPLTVLEAMAAGCPVVASDLPGCREVLGDTAGILVAPGDAVALSAALLELIADPTRRAELARAGQRRVAEMFCPQEMVDRYHAAMTGSAYRGRWPRPLENSVGA